MLEHSSQSFDNQNPTRSGGDLGVGISTRIFTLNEQFLEADVTNIQDIAESQLRLLIRFYNLALKQSEDSFRWALIAAGIGTSFFLASIILFFVVQIENLSIISMVGGIIIEFISAINFYLYKKTSSHLAESQARLDATQRFLLANSICDSLEGDFKQKTRSEIVQAFVKNSGTVEGKNLLSSTINE